MFDVQGNPTTLQAGDVLVFKPHNGALTILRDEKPLLFELGKDIVGEPKNYHPLTFIPFHYDSCGCIVDIIASCFHLSFEFLKSDDRVLAYRLKP